MASLSTSLYSEGLDQRTSSREELIMEHLPQVRWIASRIHERLSDNTSLVAKPIKGYRAAYQINSLLFISTPESKLGQFKGTLYGYLVVYREHERRNQDIMPVHMIFN